MNVLETCRSVDRLKVDAWGRNKDLELFIEYVSVFHSLFFTLLIYIYFFSFSLSISITVKSIIFFFIYKFVSTLRTFLFVIHPWLVHDFVRKLVFLGYLFLSLSYSLSLYIFLIDCMCSIDQSLVSACVV